MLELAPNIFYLPGKNKSRFPYCACLYLKGRNLRVLIDAGMGGKNLQPVKEMGIDALILSHCHIDHRLTRREIPDVPVWAHAAAAPYLYDRERFFHDIGFYRSGLDLNNLMDAVSPIFDITLDRTLKDGDTIDLGGMTLETITTPGHSPDHLAFFIPEYRLLFSADVDLTPFGPYYGHDFADIDDFILSITKLIQVDAEKAATGHAGPFNKDIQPRFEAYRRIVSKRDEIILNRLNRPQSLADLKGRNLIYRTYPPDDYLIQWFEQVHIEKHLRRLLKSGNVRQEDGAWVRN